MMCSEKFHGCHSSLNVQGNIISLRSGKSQGILPLGISRKSQGKVGKHKKYSEASKAGRNIQGQFFSDRTMFCLNEEKLTLKNVKN